MWWLCILTLYGVSLADTSCGRCGALHLELLNPSFARYKVRWCSSETQATDWNLSAYVLNKSSDQCTQNLINPNIRGESLHSQNEEQITPEITDYNGCKQMCLTVELDMLYAGCYKFMNLLTKGDKHLTPCKNVMYLNNTKTIQEFLRAKPVFKVESEGENITVNWYSGHIPINEFSIKVSQAMDVQMKPSHAPYICGRVDSVHVWCSFGPLAAAAYRIHFEHYAPWVNGVLAKLRIYSREYEHVPVEVPPLSPLGGTGRWGAAGGVAGGGAAVLGAALLVALLKTQDGRRWRKKVWSAWSPRPAPPVSPSPSPSVLIVCSWSDRALGSAVGAALKQRGVSVLELQGAKERAIAAQSPIQWINTMLDRCVVVFIDSPALGNILKDPDLSNDVVPLLPPRPTDALVLAAAGRARAAQGQPAVYRKYYVASVNGANSLPTVCPLTRYELPAALRALVDTIRPATTDNKEAVTYDTGPQITTIA